MFMAGLNQSQLLLVLVRQFYIALLFVESDQLLENFGVVLPLSETLKQMVLDLAPVSHVSVDVRYF